ncbi:MAG: D-tyrosyl-tRNA(Tyr) deacylase [Chloroflexi bacterium]|nr:MAG: D-tyrosyl-tRNA(Tyr) deacylase [Chloroflexota bacterium]MBA4375165.1 D-tyrosyl-tRNA(Tyr) deacylase [Anaerolinea sp.]
MRAIIQRVSFGQVIIDDKLVADIKMGLVILLGVGREDDQNKASLLAKKIAQLRIFEDDQGKMNLSLVDVKGSAIVVSQFTLYADTRKGNRPSFINAAPPEIASPLVDFFTEELRKERIPTQTGEFGAHMFVHLQNDGPVTISLEI